MALTEKLRAIGDAIRGKTGKTAEMTLDQMVAEIAGIEAGGNGLLYDMGDIVLDADLQDTYGIPHNLGAVPDFVVVWSDDFVNRAIPTDYADNVGFIFMRDISGLPVYLTSAVTSKDGIIIKFARSKNADVK